MTAEITPQAVGAAIVELIGLLPGGSAQPEEKPLTDDEIAALKARGYEVTKAEKPAEKPAETKQGAEQTGITNVTDLLKVAAERSSATRGSTTSGGARVASSWDERKSMTPQERMAMRSDFNAKVDREMSIGQ